MFLGSVEVVASPLSASVQLWTSVKVLNEWNK